MQGTTRWGLIVVGLIAVVFVVMGGQAQGATQEVCMTPDLYVASGQGMFCTLRNAYAYGTMPVVLAELLDGDGGVVVHMDNTQVQPLGVLSLGHTVGQTDTVPFSCRFTVLEPLPGYVRATVQRFDPVTRATLA